MTGEESRDREDRNIQANDSFDPPSNWHRIQTLDMHTGGEPLRIITNGLPDLKGDSILEKRRYMREELDNFRRALMWEPRGHADMYGCVITEPSDDEADFGVLFLHNEGYSTMCGHAIIALAKAAIETTIIPGSFPNGQVAIETPAGVVEADASLYENSVTDVEFTNVPSFVYERGVPTSVPNYGTVECDIAFGGAFYVYCNASDFGLQLQSDELTELIRVGQLVKRAVSDVVSVEHPFEDDLGYIYGTILTGDSFGSADSRNVCIFADGEVDRSPTGTGVSGRVARRAADGRLNRGDTLSVESITGSVFTGRYEESVSFGGYEAIRPIVGGRAYITGNHEFLIDPEDEFGDGFLVR